jgi:hypothetical protein
MAMYSTHNAHRVKRIKATKDNDIVVIILILI